MALRFISLLCSTNKARPFESNSQSECTIHCIVDTPICESLRKTDPEKPVLFKFLKADAFEECIVELKIISADSNCPRIWRGGGCCLCRPTFRAFSLPVQIFFSKLQVNTIVICHFSWNIWNNFIKPEEEDWLPHNSKIILFNLSFIVLQSNVVSLHNTNENCVQCRRMCLVLYHASQWSLMKSWSEP